MDVFKPQKRVKEKAQPFFFAKKKNDTAAILIHGFTGSPYDMRELGEFLFENDVNVYTVRLAGHGTTVDDLLQTTHDEWVRSVEDALLQVERQHKRVFLVGYSFGANIALDIAYQNPERFDGIVCLGPSIFLRMSKLKQLYYRYLNFILPYFGIKKWRKPYIPKNMVAAHESTGHYAYIPLSSMLEFKHFLDKHTLQQIRHIQDPILIIHSREDEISDPKGSEYLFERVGSSYKELFMFPELFHNPLRSENRDKIFSRVIHFIES